MLKRLKKHWHRSRTILHNLISAALTLVPILLMTDLEALGISGSTAAWMILALKLIDNFANIGWRAATTKPLEER